MANVGTAAAGKTLIGAGNGASPTFASIGTNSGLTANGVVLSQGAAAFSSTSAGVLGQVLTSNGAGSNPTFQTLVVGDVFGPASSTNNDIVVFSGTTGKIIKDTGISSTAPSFSGDVSTGGNFNLPQTTTTIGQIKMAGNLYLHSGVDISNTFCGSGAGNTSNASVGSSAFGQGSLGILSSGISNTCFGHVCGSTISTGSFNTAIGEAALFNCAGGTTGTVAIGWHTQLGASGNYNIGIGYSVMTAGVSGTDNYGAGRACLASVGSGSGNVITGATSGQNLTSGSNNTVYGYNALANTLNTGSTNLILGTGSGNSYTAAESSNILLSNSGTAAESNVMRLGTSGSGSGQVNKAYIAGVNGVTVTGSAVLCATDGQLGTVVSSERYKKEIETLEKSDILSLRPVTFRYKNDTSNAEQVGLIAEEVEKIIPRLCIYDNVGQIQSVKYHEICTYLLLEIKNMSKRLEAIEQKG